MLAEAFGSGQKLLYNTRVRDSDDIYAQAIGVNESRIVMLVSKISSQQSVQILGGSNGLAYVLEGVGLEPGFSPPVSRNLDEAGTITLGPFAVAIVRLPIGGAVALV